MKPIHPENRRLRRLFLRLGLASMGAAVLSACDRLSHNDTFVEVLQSAQKLSYRVQKLVTGRKAMAQEFSEADIAPSFRSNGTAIPNSKRYRELANNRFADWALEVDGMVEKPIRLSLAELQAMPSRTQITRHDCVEGWSAIGKWHGVQLSRILNHAGLSTRARYIVFHCADRFGDKPYYESIDLVDAFHPQTILAWGMNGHLLPVPNGAPLRLRVERQLGYKHAKYVQRIQAVDSLARVWGGKGGYWEDNVDYEWYAGI